MVLVDIILPVYNEEIILEKSVKELRDFLKGMPEYTFRILIVDNGSTDKTYEIAKKLAEDYPNVDVMHLEEKGRGGALKKAWSQSTADVMCYMDVDLSTDLNALKKLIDSIAKENYDIVVGSRFAKGSKTKRSLLRDILSKGYNTLVKFLLKAEFSDAQCGFKAVNKRLVYELLPKVEDSSWFFDTELLVLAEKNAYKIKEIPILWEDIGDSKVEIFHTTFSYIKNILNLRKRLT